METGVATATASIAGSPQISVIDILRAEGNLADIQLILSTDPVDAYATKWLADASSRAIFLPHLPIPTMAVFRARPGGKMVLIQRREG